jgi:hypothetical protein
VNHHLMVMEHSKTQPSRLVSPPLLLCLRWCTSQAEAGWSQPPAH